MYLFRVGENKVMKRIIAVFLAVIMIFGMIPAEVSSAASKKTEDIAFFGIDKMNGDCDTIYIVHIDHSKKTAKVMSIYRDCYVKIKNHGYGKIKWSYQWGGKKLAMDTINRNFDLKVKDCVAVDFETFSSFINDIGGVKVTLDKDEAKVMKQWKTGIKKSGTHKLKGSQALIYCRIRKECGGDYARTDRNRKMFKAVFNKAQKMSTTKKLKLAKKYRKKINTTLSLTEIKSLIKKIPKYRIESDTAYPDVFYTATYKKLWVEFPYSLADMSTSVHKYLYPNKKYTPSKNVKKYSKGIISLKKHARDVVLTSKSGVYAKANGGGAVTIRWNKVSYAKSYSVYFKRLGKTKWNYEGKTNSRSLRAYGYASGVKYSYMVVANCEKKGKKYKSAPKVSKPLKVR